MDLTYTEQNHALCKELLDILQSSTCPEQSFEIAQPCEVDRFKDYVSNVESNIRTSISLLKSVESIQNPSLRKDIVINTVILCGEHSENNIWTNPEIVILSNLLLNELLRKCNISNLSDLLVAYTCDSFLSKLRFKLDKTTWKNYPAAVVCFKWILNSIKCPHLGDLLSKILPTCLILVDDYEYNNKVTGLYCLEHLAKNVSRTELAQYGRGTVIYKALEHMIYFRESQIIRPLASCLVALLGSTEHQPNITTLKWNHFDDVLNIWLPSMEMEQQVVLREAYIDCVDLLVAAMGLSSVRWSRKLLSVLSEYCEQENTEVQSLKCLQTFINASWPRVPSNFKSIVLILMKVVLRSASGNEKILHLVKDCLRSLETHSKPQFSELIREIREKSEMSLCYAVLTDKDSDYFS